MTPTKAIIAGLFVVAGAMPATAEILLGASISATGPASALGDPEAKTLEMLVEELNGKGGINGETVKLVLYDDAGDPNKARTFATRLVEEAFCDEFTGGRDADADDVVTRGVKLKKSSCAASRWL